VRRKVGHADPEALIPGDYSYSRHVEWLRAALFDVLDLHDITYVGQDWGGLIGMRLLAEHPERFARVVMANTGLPTGDVPMPEVWQRFRQMVQQSEHLDVARTVDSGRLRTLSDQEKAAYDAPYPSELFLAGVRTFPGLVPNTPDDPAAPANKAAWQRLSTLEVPFLTAFSDSDPITCGAATGGCASASPELRGSPTRRSRGRATSSRRTSLSASPRSSLASSGVDELRSATRGKVAPWPRSSPRPKGGRRHARAGRSP